MSFNYGSKSRHRPTGRHFKLFSDELPRIEFDKATFEEYNNAANEKRRTKGKRRSFRDSNLDRFSLPSLGTPEWDGMSEGEKNRPQSYSPFNPLNPNFSKIHQKIQRRNTLKETKVSNWNRNHTDKFQIRQNDDVDKQQYTNAWNENVRKSQTEHDHNKIHTPEHDKESEDELNTSVESLKSTSKVVTDKPPVPKKRSVFKELLDASAKETARMNRIKEGLKFNASNVYRHHSMKSHRVSSLSQERLENVSKVDTNTYNEENSVPEIISEKDEKTKPGILKHGVRLRESNVMKASNQRDFPVKPRLIHQEDLPLFGKDDEAHGIKSSNDEVRVSVYADTPLNRLVDMMFVPLPSSKPTDKRKKVNFNSHIDIKERTAMSELVEADNENSDDTNPETEISDRANDLDKENVTAVHNRKSVQIRRRTNVRHKDVTKPLNKHIVTITHKNRSIEAQSHYNEKFVHSSKHYIKESQHDTDKQDYIDSILLSSKPVARKMKDLRAKPLWKEAKPAVTEVLVHEPDPVDIIAKVNSPVEPEVTKLSSNLARENYSRPKAHLSLVTFPNTRTALNNGGSGRCSPRSPPRSPPKSPDIDSMSDFTSFFDEDINLDDLPEEIDRSMLGEDLIKAYRLWDRKRKAFPGGLRKIEAPIDRKESSYPKQYGNVKTYKITNPRLDKPPIAPTHNKTSQNSVLMDWV